MGDRAKVGHDKSLSLLNNGRPPGPTTHSPANRDFLTRRVLPRFGGDLRKRIVSAEENLVLMSLLWVFVSTCKILFPGNGDRVRRDSVRIWN